MAPRTAAAIDPGDSFAAICTMSSSVRPEPCNSMSGVWPVPVPAMKT
jgi:hypothetical protein